MRPACPVLIYPCEFINFSTSRSTLDLAGRRPSMTLRRRTGGLSAYARAGTDQNLA